MKAPQRSTHKVAAAFERNLKAKADIQSPAPYYVFLECKQRTEEALAIELTHLKV